MLDEFALFLDDEDLLEPLGKRADAVGLERPRHADLVDAQADRSGDAFVDAEFGKRFHRVGMRLARRDDAEAGGGRVPDDAVDTIGLGEGERGKALEALQPRVLLAPDIAAADVDAAFGEVEGREDYRVPFVGEVDRGARLDGVGGRLEADPGAGEARHREAEQPVFDEFVHRRRREEGHERRLEIMVGLVRQRRRLGAVIVADDRQHTAVGRRACRIGVFEDVHGAVEAGSLAVPDAEDAIDGGAGAHPDMLRPPHGGRAELLVDAGLEDDVVVGEQLLGPPQLLIVVAQRRSAIARDEAAGIQPRRAVARALHQRQANQAPERPT